MKKRNFLFSIVILFLIISCSPLPTPPKTKEINTYLLEWEATKLPDENKKQPSSPALLVTPMRSAPGYETSAIIYEEKPYQLNHFAYHRWAETPSSMLSGLIITALGKVNAFKSVSSSSSQAHADLLLETKLLCLKQVFKENRSEVKFKVRATLIDLETGDVIGEKIFALSEPAAPDPYSGVEAANRAVERFLNDLIDFTEKTSNTL